MPELPEVETTVNDLRPVMVGKRIENVDVLAAATIETPSPEEFRKGLIGRKVVSINRRGKHLIFELDNHTYLIVHMRMTGSLLARPAETEPEHSIRVIFYLEDRQAVHFRDARRFGKMWLVKDPNTIVGKLGPEPLEKEFSPEVLWKLLHNRNIAIKGLLLDQTVIAGIGNMYADEALYEARLHPLRLSSSLTRSEILRLYDAIQTVLRQGIRNKGASTETYLRPGGVKGQAHLAFQVAHQKGKECPVCGGPIERIEVHQRGTFYCPKCQKLPRSKKAAANATEAAKAEPVVEPAMAGKKNK
jgi:formamidopyrimidine-DNA glycosylase